MTQEHQVSDTTTVDVRFFEEGSRDPFATSHVPLAQLPDTFEVDTVLHLGDQDWKVVRAEPSQKSEFAERGTLELFLVPHQVTQIDPSKILYSLPTINDAIAASEPVKSLDGFVMVEEDDWRQFEFIDRVHAESIREELEEIVEIYQNHRVGAGFKHLHLRQKITDPLPRTPLTISLIEQAFDVAQTYAGAAFGSSQVAITDSFAMRTTSGWLLWGQTDASGVITALNFAPTQHADVAEVASRVDAFLTAHSLYLVDWSRLFWCGEDQQAFATYGES